MTSESFGPHPQVVIAPPDHIMAKRVRINKTELCNESFIVREEGSGTRSVFDYFFDGLVMLPPRVHVEIGSNETIKQAVMAGLGLTLISAHTIEAEVADGRLAILDIIGLPILRQWFAVRHGNRELSPRRPNDMGFHRGGRARLSAEDRDAGGLIGCAIQNQKVAHVLRKSPAPFSGRALTNAGRRQPSCQRSWASRRRAENRRPR